MWVQWQCPPYIQEYEFVINVYNEYCNQNKAVKCWYPVSDFCKQILEGREEQIKL